MSRKQSTYYQTYHVYNIGVDKMTIFRDNGDLDYFCEQVNIYAEKYKIKIFAYCFIDHRYHMLIRAKRGNFKDISDFIKYTCGRYTRFFNDKSLTVYNLARSGIIFGAKYVSVPINNEEELKKCVIDIHNKSKLNINELEDYEYTSFRQYINKDKDSKVNFDTSYFEKTSRDEFLVLHQSYVKKDQPIEVQQGEYFLSYGIFKK